VRLASILWGDFAFGSKGGEKIKPPQYRSSLHRLPVHDRPHPRKPQKPERAVLALDAISAIRHVGGNHSRFLYDFRPESIAIRVTADPSPWMGCFERVGDSIGCPRLVRFG